MSVVSKNNSTCEIDVNTSVTKLHLVSDLDIPHTLEIKYEVVAKTIKLSEIRNANENPKTAIIPITINKRTKMIFTFIGIPDNMEIIVGVG